LGGKDPPVDLVISTPAAIGPLGLKPKNIDMFADIQTLVIDEADMLLDGGYIRQLENVLLGFRRADRLDSSLGVRKTQHVFVAATLPDMGLRSVDAYLKKKFPNATDVTMAGMHNARHYGLSDSTLWIEEDGGGNKERMQRLVEMLEIPKEEGGLQGEKIMVFLNSVDDVDGVSGALSRAGIDNVPYHAKIKLQERAENLDKFRRYSFGSENRDAAGVLVCTDLASRGLDVPGVTAVFNYNFLVMLLLIYIVWDVVDVLATAMVVVSYFTAQRKENWWKWYKLQSPNRNAWCSKEMLTRLKRKLIQRRQYQEDLSRMPLAENEDLPRNGRN
jgi:superfamily II DNA/RNA helicase